MIEVLVAAAILLVIALGLVPLYSRSIRSNVEGFDYTQVSNFAKSRAEEYLQYPFNGGRLQVPGGSNQLEVQDFYSAADHEWVDTVPDGDVALFTRTTTVRQFSTGDITTPLDGNAPPDAVHLKEITVEVAGSRAGGSALGPGKTISVRVLKSQ
jgi:Tfp pilus assembly protein PilV